MNKLTSFILLTSIIVISLLSFKLGTFKGTKDIDNLECPTPKCPQTKVKCPAPEVNVTKKCPEPEVETNCPDCDKGFFKRMIEAQAKNHIYKLDKYDCSQFARELKRRLEDKGFDAETESIQVDCSSGLFEEESCKKSNGRHLIVEVDNLYVESVTGNVIDPQNYGKYNIG